MQSNTSLNFLFTLYLFLSLTFSRSVIHVQQLSVFFSEMVSTLNDDGEPGDDDDAVNEYCDFVNQMRYTRS